MYKLIFVYIIIKHIYIYIYICFCSYVFISIHIGNLGENVCEHTLGYCLWSTRSSAELLGWCVLVRSWAPCCGTLKMLGPSLKRRTCVSNDKQNLDEPLV